MSEGQVVPLLGAGVNLCDRPSGQAWELGHYLPNGSELADYLAQTFYFPEVEERNLLRVSQYVVTKEGKGPLYFELRKLFDANYPVTPVHGFFAGLPGRLRERGTPKYQVILTTNYDDALERAFDAVSEPYDVVWYIADGRAAGKVLASASRRHRADGDRTSQLLRRARSRRADGDPQDPRSGRPPERGSGQLRDHRGPLHRLPDQDGHRPADPGGAPGQAHDAAISSSSATACRTGTSA